MKSDFEIEPLTISLAKFCQELNLEIIHSDQEEITFYNFNVNRPGLQLAGFFDHYGKDRVQVIGEMEMAYLSKLNDAKRQNACDTFFEAGFPCLIISSKMIPFEEFLIAAKKYNRILLRSNSRTTLLINDISFFLNGLLAPSITLHGVLVDVYGVGILMLGSSSVGKSEAALELIMRNHRLIADDAVTIKRINDSLIGFAPDNIRHLLEVRGLGIINIKSMFGASAIKDSKKIDLVIRFEIWDEKKIYDRLGLMNEKYNVLGLSIIENTIPVKPGRNISIIIEAAARKYRLNSMGDDPISFLGKSWDHKE